MGRGHQQRHRWHEAGVFAEAGRRAVAQAAQATPDVANEAEAAALVSSRLETLEAQLKPRQTTLEVAKLIQEPATKLDLHLLDTEREAKFNATRSDLFGAILRARGIADKNGHDMVGLIGRVSHLERRQFYDDDDEGQEKSIKISRAAWDAVQTRLRTLDNRCHLMMKLLREARKEPNKQETFELMQWDEEEIMAESKAMDG